LAAARSVLLEHARVLCREHVHCSTVAARSWALACSTNGALGGARHTWFVATSGTSAVLPDMADGCHSLSLWAVDGRGRVQRSPTGATWVVDTVPRSPTRLYVACGGVVVLTGSSTGEPVCVVMT
jgi:hypothetical protein